MENDFNLHEFKKHLTEWEQAVFSMKEERLDRQHQIAQLALMKEYNDMASERISHAILIQEIQELLSFSSPELRLKLEKMDNNTLQAIVSIVMSVEKEANKITNKE